MVHYLDHGEVVHEFIPFRIEHIIEVIELSLHDLIKTRELDFEVNTHFTTKFLLGNRMEILVSLLQLSHSVMIQNSKSDVHVQINYLSEPNRLLIAFQAQNLKVSEFEVPFDTELESDDNNLKLAFSCNAILEQSNSAVKFEISDVEFPYLFNISGGDKAIAQDIFNTIVDSVRPEVDQLEHDFTSENWENLERLAHKLRPNFISLERRDLAEVLQKMEQFAIEQSESHFEVELNKFLPVAKRLLSDLVKYQA